MTQIIRIQFALSIIALGIIPSPMLAQNVHVGNTYCYKGQGRFDWELSLRDDPTTLKKIGYVTYTLDPSFPDPVRAVCDNAANGFALKSSGWGEFSVYIKVEWRNKRTTYQSYRLDLHSAQAGKCR